MARGVNCSYSAPDNGMQESARMKKKKKKGAGNLDPRILVLQSLPSDKPNVVLSANPLYKVWPWTVPCCFSARRASRVSFAHAAEHEGRETAQTVPWWCTHANTSMSL